MTLTSFQWEGNPSLCKWSVSFSACFLLKTKNVFFWCCRWEEIKKLIPHQKKLNPQEGFPNPFAFCVLGKADLCGLWGIFSVFSSMENQHLAGTVRITAKVFSCLYTADRSHAHRITEQKIKLVSSVLFYAGYFCMWEVKRWIPATWRGTLLVSPLPQDF